MKWHLSWTVHRIVNGGGGILENYSQTETNASILKNRDLAIKRINELKSMTLPNTKELIIYVGLFELERLP